MEKAKALWALVKQLPWLELLLLAIAAGNADVMLHYLVATGSEETIQLIVAVYALEILVVWASLWRTVGLFISFCLFLVSMISISHMFKDQALGHSGFSIAVFLGSLGNYVRHGHWRELSWLFKVVFDIRNAKTILNNAFNNFVDLSSMTIADVRMRFGVTIEQATKAKQLANNGVQLTADMIKEL